MKGRKPKHSHEDRLLIRALWAKGREQERVSLREIARKFDVSIETIRRIICLDDLEMEKLRQNEIIRAGGDIQRETVESRIDSDLEIVGAVGRH